MVEPKYTLSLLGGNVLLEVLLSQQEYDGRWAPLLNSTFYSFVPLMNGVGPGW